VATAGGNDIATLNDKLRRKSAKMPDLLREVLWLVFIVAVPYYALVIKHGWGESVRNGDLFLFNITALAAVLFEWLVSKPPSFPEFLRPSYFLFLGVIGFGALGWTVYLFADSPLPHSPREVQIFVAIGFALIMPIHRIAKREPGAEGAEPEETS
jgi:hypothetical protein